MPCKEALESLAKAAKRDAKAKNDQILKLANQVQRLQSKAQVAELTADSKEKYNPIALKAWKNKITQGKTQIENKFRATSETLPFLPPPMRSLRDDLEMHINMLTREIDESTQRNDDHVFIMLEDMAEHSSEKIERRFDRELKDIAKADPNTDPDELKDFSKEILKIFKDLFTIPTSEEIISRTSSLEDENKSLLTSNKSLSAENKIVIDMKNSLAKERDSLKQLNESFKGDKERLVGENQRLISLLEEFNSLPENPSTQKVFPYVNWGEANPSQAWYKDIDWSAVPFKKLSEVEINGLDWSKINYTQAQNSSSFNITALAWDQINELSEKSKKKVYNKIDWSKIKFNSMTTGASDVFDWSFVDMKNIHWSPGFTLNVVEIDEIKGQKGFKQLAKELKKESSWSDGYLAEASEQILQEIGYENFVGKITDKKRQEFTTDNGDKYTLVMKPLSYERANAVAKAMGGRLAAIDGNESNSFVDKLTGILAQKSVSNNLSQTEVNDVSAAWFGYSATDNTSAYTPIKLAELASSGVEDLANAYNTNSLWFIVET